MNFDYNEEQQLLADSVRRFIRKDYDFESRKKIVASAGGWSEQVWGTFAEMGLLGLPFSPDYGGVWGGAAGPTTGMGNVAEGPGGWPCLPHACACGKVLRRVARPW